MYPYGLEFKHAYLYQSKHCSVASDPRSNYFNWNGIVSPIRIATTHFFLLLFLYFNSFEYNINIFFIFYSRKECVHFIRKFDGLEFLVSKFKDCSCHGIFSRMKEHAIFPNISKFPTQTNAFTFSSIK